MALIRHLKGMLAEFEKRVIELQPAFLQELLWV
jgi:hypothetical protein